MHGIEINPYAAELHRSSSGSATSQWLHEHNIDDRRRPILDTLQCIENRDAILDFAPSPGTPGEGGGGENAEEAQKAHQRTRTNKASRGRLMARS